MCQIASIVFSQSAQRTSAPLALQYVGSYQLPSCEVAKMSDHDPEEVDAKADAEKAWMAAVFGAATPDTSDEVVVQISAEERQELSLSQPE